ncbi:MAG: hypothetical protein HeimC3_00150 [Candidatus Heimdallarchaeota archaeon LC_3]|nr:MAG: hypothetical protein HeimC3_50410 [Candidatus Heimdallarchaeota archaeon LC_3]OLS28056.1 MAG: hypothetical protein HeimC3_00150 [Candidatus Heimdallarchaeota archaeon LC_3]
MKKENFTAIGLEIDFIRLFSYHELEKSKNLGDNSLIAKFQKINFSKSSLWDDDFHELSLLAWYAFHTFPGQEMWESVQIAENTGIPYFLLDQNIHTMQREVQNLSTDRNHIVIDKRDLKMVTKLLKILCQLDEDAKFLCIVGRAHLNGLFSRYETIQQLGSKKLYPILLWEG